MFICCHYIVNLKSVLHACIWMQLLLYHEVDVAFFIVEILNELLESVFLPTNLKTIIIIIIKIRSNSSWVFLLCPLQVYKSRWRPWRFGACCLPRVCTHGGSVLTQKHCCSRNDASGFQQTCGLIKQHSVEREEALSAVCGEIQLISGTNRNNGCNKSSTGWLQLALQV